MRIIKNKSNRLFCLIFFCLFQTPSYAASYSDVLYPCSDFFANESNLLEENFSQYIKTKSELVINVRPAFRKNWSLRIIKKQNVSFIYFIDDFSGSFWRTQWFGKDRKAIAQIYLKAFNKASEKILYLDLRYLKTSLIYCTKNLTIQFQRVKKECRQV